MKRLTFALSALLLLTAAPAMAQQKAAPPAPKPAKRPFTLGISPGEVTATPEMWFYQQELQQYQDPKVAVREKAEMRAAQRLRRMAAMKWFGFSNQRPRAGVDPFHGDYSPSWSGNNSNYPFRWYGNGQPWIAVRPAVPATRIY
jgi:hypothetical protein